MPQFSTLTLLNTLTDDFGQKVLKIENNTLYVKGQGLFKVDDDHDINKIKIEGHQEYRDIVEIANLESMVSDPTKTYRIEFYIESNANADHIFANSLSRKSKTVFVEFNTIDQFYTNLNRFQTMTYGSQLLTLVGELDGSVENGKSFVTSAHKSSENNYLIASNCYIRVMKAEVQMADNFGKFYSIGNLDIYHGSTGLGTREDITKNYILPTAYNTRFCSLTTKEQPISGELYDLFFINADVKRGILGNSAIGQHVDAKNIHCFCIKQSESNEFEQMFDELINSKGGGKKGPKVRGLYYNEDTDLYEVGDYYLGDPIGVDEIAGTSNPQFVVLTEDQKNKFTRIIFVENDNSIYDSNEQPEILNNSFVEINQEFIDASGFDVLSDNIGDYLSIIPSMALDIKEGNVLSYKYTYDGVEYEVTLPPHDYSKDYLTIVSLEDDNVVSFKRYGNDVIRGIDVSTDNGLTWVHKISSTEGIELAILNAGEKLLIKGNNLSYADQLYSYQSYSYVNQYNYFQSTKDFNITGNILSMFYGDDFQLYNGFSSNYGIMYLFFECNHLINAKNCIFPSENIGPFGCRNMFKGCSSLKTAPQLPLTNLSRGCYEYMFEGCTSLKTAPELPATTLVDYCYYHMFYACTSLKYIKCLATNLSYNTSTEQWTDNVSPTGIFIKSEDSDWSIRNSGNTNSGIPSGWDQRNEGWYYGISLSSSVINCSLEDDSYIFPTISIEDPDVTYTLSSSDTSIVNIVNNEPVILDNYGSAIITISLHETNINKYIGYGTASYLVNVYQTKNKLSLLRQPLTFTALEDTTFRFSNNALQYSLDDGYTWATLNANTNSPTVTAGNKILWKQSGLTPISSNGIGTFSSTGNFEISGNIMSLLYGDEFLEYNSLRNYSFYKLFFSCTKLISAENLILYSSILSQECYKQMFYNCTSLTNVPELHFSTLASNCCYYMFSNCTSLTTAPKLPITTLAASCYGYMFSGCTSLTTVPKLPITTLAASCYSYMFQGCTSLTMAPELPATTLENDCYHYMFQGCTSLTMAPELPATTLAISCYGYMFSGCTSLTSAPELPATTLTQSCYQYMFSNCTSLTSAPELPATTLAQYCYQYMFRNCTSLTNAPELPATTLTQYCYYYMFQGCSALNHIKCLATNISASNCTSNWVKNIANTGVFIKEDSMKNWTIGYNGIPSNWESYINSNMPISWENYTYYLSIIALSKPKLINPYNLDVTYTSSDESVATIDQFGSITYVGIGTTTLTALFNGNENYKAKTTTCTLTLREYEQYVDDYLTFTALEDTTFRFSNNALQYSLDDGSTWTKLNASSNSPTVTAGNKILWKQSGLTPTSSNGIGTFSSTGNFEISGNIMSLLYGDEFFGKTNFEDKTYAFYGLFKLCANLISAEHLILPATTLSNYCYYYMFQGCSALTTVPELPATTLSNYCYSYMFSNCTSLTTVPELPATTLAQYCYSRMFNSCTSLTITNELPATTLANYCYQYMFNGCTSLTRAPELLATTLADYCYEGMFEYCTSLTITPELPATTLATSCYRNMFNGCSSLTTAPELSATTLAQNCYASMFYDCTSLTTAPQLSATTLASSCYSTMFYGCTSLTKAPELPATTLAISCYEGMFNGCTNLNYIKCLAINMNVTNCTYNWVNNVAQMGVFVKNQETTNWKTGNNGIPSNWYISNGSETPIGWSTTSLTCGINYLSKPKFANPYNLDVTYTSSDESVATIDQLGNITYIGLGTTILAALFNGDENYEAKTATCTLTLLEAQYDFDYFTIESLCDSNTISFKSDGYDSKKISISANNGLTWVSRESSRSGTVLSILNIGDKLLIKGDNTSYGQSSSYNYFQSTGNFNISGNIMSLLFQDNFIQQTSLEGKQYAFYHLFQSCSKLISAEHLILPATTLSNYCYSYMFSNCTSLTTIPELPATTLAQYCYDNMFRNCTSLTSAPELPATTLANYCYQYMFSGCTSLTNAPELPATTLTQYCYRFMFQGCSALTTAPVLPATTLANNCYERMFENCTSLTTAPVLPATTLSNWCYASMFYGCTSLTTAPVLHATILTQNCYNGMFSGCTNLNYIKCLATNRSASNCTYNWVQNVSASGTFVKNYSSSWATGNSSVPSGWTIYDENNGDDGME